MIRLALLRWPTCTPSRSLGLQENHVRGRPKNPARTLGCEGPKSAGFSAHPVRAEALAGQPCGAMCEDFVRILAMVHHGPGHVLHGRSDYHLNPGCSTNRAAGYARCRAAALSDYGSMPLVLLARADRAPDAGQDFADC